MSVGCVLGTKLQCLGGDGSRSVADARYAKFQSLHNKSKKCIRQICFCCLCDCSIVFRSLFPAAPWKCVCVCVCVCVCGCLHGCSVAFHVAWNKVGVWSIPICRIFAMRTVEQTGKLTNAGRLKASHWSVIGDLDHRVRGPAPSTSTAAPA